MGPDRRLGACRPGSRRRGDPRRAPDDRAAERQIAEFVKAGADGITIHVEATPHVHYTLSAIREGGCTAGAAICPATPIESLFDAAAAEVLDMALCMSVNPGWGNQVLIPHSFEKLRRMRAALADAGRARGGWRRPRTDGRGMRSGGREPTGGRVGGVRLRRSCRGVLRADSRGLAAALKVRGFPLGPPPAPTGRVAGRTQEYPFPQCHRPPISIPVTWSGRLSWPAAETATSAPTRWSARYSPMARRPSGRASTASSGARTPRSRRFAAPPGVTSVTPRCTCRSSPAATSVGRRRAPMRSGRRGSQGS